MTQARNSTITPGTAPAFVGIDLAKNSVPVHGVDEAGGTGVERKLKPAKLKAFLSNRAPCVVGMEACGRAHPWGREVLARGQEAKLMAPQFVKPYVQSNQNDRADATAICEAVQRPNLRFVGIKSADRQARQGPSCRGGDSGQWGSRGGGAAAAVPGGPGGPLRRAGAHGRAGGPVRPDDRGDGRGRRTGAVADDPSRGGPDDGHGAAGHQGRSGPVPERPGVCGRARVGPETVCHRWPGAAAGDLETGRPGSARPADPWCPGDGHPAFPEGEDGPAQPVAPGLAGAASQARGDGGAGEPDGADGRGRAQLSKAVRGESRAGLKAGPR